MVAEMPRFSRIGLRRSPEFAQQVVVLHVARAHLQDVDVVGEQRDLGLIHHFAHQQQMVAVGRFAQQLQALFAHALKAVGRGARLERAAAQHFRAAAGHGFGHLADLIAIFDAARPGHDHHLVAADFDVADLDCGARGFEVAAGQLVRRNDAVAFLDARHDFEFDGIDVAHRAHAAQHGVQDAGGAMDDEAHGHQTVDDVLGLRLFGAFLHDNEHGVRDLRFQYSETGGLRAAAKYLRRIYGICCRSGFWRWCSPTAAGAKSWMRVAMLAAAVPTTIVANALRVSFSGLSPLLTSGTPHALLGTVIFVLCLGLLAGICRLIELASVRMHEL